MANSQATRRTNVVILSMLLLFALLGLAGATSVAITAIMGSTELADEYRPEIFFTAVLLSVAVLSIGFVACLGLAAQIRRQWRSLERSTG
jgi:hypothetical protein